jgi:hypothetical protein
MAKDKAQTATATAATAGLPEDVQKLLAGGKKLTAERHPQVGIEEKAGNYLIGQYKGSRPMPNTDDGTLHMFVMEKTSGPTTEWSRESRTKVPIVVEPGTVVEIRGNTALDRMLKGFDGHRLGLVYQGLQASQKVAGRRFHNYEVTDFGV